MIIEGYYAIRHKDGRFMPNYGTRKGRGGWTNDEPQWPSKVPPRLFIGHQYAAAALREWLKGAQYQVIVRTGSFEGVDDDYDIRIRPRPDRRTEDMSIVRVLLTTQSEQH